MKYIKTVNGEFTGVALLGRRVMIQTDYPELIVALLAWSWEHDAIIPSPHMYPRNVHDSLMMLIYSLPLYGDTQLEVSEKYHQHSDYSCSWWQRLCDERSSEWARTQKATISSFTEYLTYVNSSCVSSNEYFCRCGHIHTGSSPPLSRRSSLPRNTVRVFIYEDHKMGFCTECRITKPLYQFERNTVQMSLDVNNLIDELTRLRRIEREQARIVQPVHLDEEGRLVNERITTRINIYNTQQPPWHVITRTYSMRTEQYQM